MNRYKRWIARVIFLCGFLLIGNVCQPVCAAEPSQQTEKRVVKVGYYQIPGFQEYDEQTGEYSGYGYEYLLALAQYENWTYDFVDCTFSEGVELLEQGKIDLMNNVSVTDERLVHLAYSELPSGSNCAYLAMNKDNQSVAFEDFEAFSDIKVGLVTTSINSQRLIDYCVANNCMPQITYYDTQDEAQKALAEGTIDARVITSSRNEDMHIIAKFAPEDYYFAVPKGETDLLKELNQSMSSLKTNDPDFENRLNDKYYGNISDEDTVLTEKEQEFVKNSGTIDVYYDNNFAPVSYTDSDGNFAGTMADIFQLLSNETGLKFNFQAATVDTINRLSAKNDNYMIAQLPYDFTWAEHWNANLSRPFVDVTVMEAFREGFTHEKGVMAVSKDYYLGEQCKAFYEGQYTFKEYENVEACMEAVKNKEADITCITSYESDYFQSQYAYRSMEYTVCPRLAYSMSIGISKNEDACLRTIITKGMNAISSDKVDALFKETSLEAASADTLTVVMNHPKVLLPIVFMIAFLVIGAVFVLIYFSNMKKKNAVIQMKNHQLAEAITQANQASDAKSDFLASMSHEIRTPMNAIVGLTTLANDHTDEPQKIKEYLYKIHTSSNVLLNIINDVLDMSSIENHKMKIAHEKFSMTQILDQITTIYLPQCKEKGIAFILEKDLRHDMLIGDSMRISQILLNLVSNAYKFTEKDGEIHVKVTEQSVKKETAFIRMEVTDTGCGMSEDMQKRLFKPFEQEAAKTAQKYGGSGLGLSIAKNLVGMMNGAIEVKSKKGAGTTFTVDLPIEINESVQPTNEEQVIDQTAFDFTGHKLLLAEDNDLNAEIAIEILQMENLVIDRAEDGQRAIELFSASKIEEYEAILMDVQMPNVDGYEATKAIRKLDRADAAKVPILAMTANAFQEDIAKALSAGMDGHIAKPIDTDNLFGTLRQALTSNKSKTCE